MRSNEGICTTSLNLHELQYGVRKYAKQVGELPQLPVLSFTRRDAETSARIELESERRGRPIRRIDGMIAAVPMNSSSLLYTFDKKHFEPLLELGLKLFR